ncbi:hypothetical protein [uncultured Gilliamella sp.]|uniref:hypothetical protein n=1 Tax=uncultured Gilliamella sp. TaxID=1193505 RepID=UPI0025FD9D5E|nr:hypothetical protein [uncultured Gilliamella sp.]
MKKYTKQYISNLATSLEICDLHEDWSGIDAILPIIEKIKKEKSVFIIEFDGKRDGVNDNGTYTIFIMGDHLLEKDILIRTDAYDLNEGLCYVIGTYADIFWQKFH